MTDDCLAKARTRGIAEMVERENGVIWADGHALKTLGAHTGHMVAIVALCVDADWANAIAAAIAKSTPTSPAVLPGRVG